jgi:hypothetical protein
VGATAGLGAGTPGTCVEGKGSTGSSLPSAEGSADAKGIGSSNGSAGTALGSGTSGSEDATEETADVTALAADVTTLVAPSSWPRSPLTRVRPVKTPTANTPPATSTRNKSGRPAEFLPRLSCPHDDSVLPCSDVASGRTGNVSGS